MSYSFKHWHEEQAVKTIDTSVHDCRYWKQHNDAKLPDGDSYLYEIRKNIFKRRTQHRKKS